MKQYAAILAISLIVTLSVSAQVKPAQSPTPTTIPSIVPVKPGSTMTPMAEQSARDMGSVSGRTYTNKTFGFEVSFPETWLIPDSNLETSLKKNGYNLHVADLSRIDPRFQADIRHFEKQVTLLLTVYRSLPGTIENGIMLISAENLAGNPQIKDAVDYLDAIRATYITLRLPPDFKYSETRAEKLGSMQFGFLDTSAKTGKKRLYATVRNGFAIMFTISYTSGDDLLAMRQVLTRGNFALK